MLQNVGNTDRIVRLIAGLGLLIAAGFATGPARWLALVSLVPLGTAALGYCPLYQLIGVSSCRFAARAGKDA